jgi:hypothetical protein
LIDKLCIKKTCSNVLLCVTLAPLFFNQLIFGGREKKKRAYGKMEKERKKQ